MTIQRTIVRKQSVIHGQWQNSSVPRFMQKILENRGIGSPDQTELRLNKLLHPETLGGLSTAVDIVIEAIQKNQSIIIAGDYDCDGATGTAVAVRGLKMLGANNVDFTIPDRFKHGYGLSPELVGDMQPTPDLIITVDSGTSSFAGVEAAKARGIRVVITDHHLPADALPDADAIVNPNLKDDDFPSKALAGVGVMFYLLVAIRAELRRRGCFSQGEPDLTELLDIVALGTVADLVPLDLNNRILVDAGLRRIRAGKITPGIKALIEVSNREAERLVASDFGFAIGPRLNAAGRLENMRLGVEALLTDSYAEAREKTFQLDAINQERKELQAEMIFEAESIVSQESHSAAVGVVVFNHKWHSGVVGLVASKLKENLHRPVFALAPSEPGSDELRGSGRSIEGFHLRDALAVLDVHYPGLMLKFGGHAMAAGLSLRITDVDLFTKAFNEIATEFIAFEYLDPIVLSDGSLESDELSLETAKIIQTYGPWGQAFPEPIFDNYFYVNQWRTLKDKHLKLLLEDPRSGRTFEAIMFSAEEFMPPPVSVRIAYEIGVNVWRGKETLQLMVKHLEPSQLKGI